MIVRIQSSGGSFRGAGKYYLHDKSADASLEKGLKPKTDERVWFTDTRNCLELDPARALDEMWRTAEDQADLKMQAGVKRGGRVGKPCQVFLAGTKIRPAFHSHGALSTRRCAGLAS